MWYNKANKTTKDIIKANYNYNGGKYTFNNSKISVDDIKILTWFV